MTRLLFWLVAGLLLGMLAAGCANMGGPGQEPRPSHLTVWIDPQVQPLPVVKGMAIWQDVGVYVDVVTVREGANFSFLPDVLPDCSPDSAGRIWDGQARISQQLAVLRLPCWPEAGLAGSRDSIEMQAVAAHEFGHLVGMDHIEDGSCNIMNPGPCVPDPNHMQLSDGDRQQFWRLWGGP
jgi:hypothetical protein